MDSLVEIFVRIESSITSRGINYDKFRYKKLRCIFECFWGSELFKEKFKEMINSRSIDLFLNCVLNDNNRFFEEGISALKKIKQFESKYNDEDEPSEEEIQQYESNQDHFEDSFKLSAKCLWMIKEISNWAKELLSKEAFATRLASSFILFLNKVVSPIFTNLTNEEREAYDVDQLKMLDCLNSIYLDLCENDFFKKYVISDSNYDLPFFVQASKDLKKQNMNKEYKRL